MLVARNPSHNHRVLPTTPTRIQTQQGTGSQARNYRLLAPERTRNLAYLNHRHRPPFEPTHRFPPTSLIVSLTALLGELTRESTRHDAFQKGVESLIMSIWRLRKISGRDRHRQCRNGRGRGTATVSEHREIGTESGSGIEMGTGRLGGTVILEVTLVAVAQDAGLSVFQRPTTHFLVGTGRWQNEWDYKPFSS
jgi:hypothetical protein